MKRSIIVLLIALLITAGIPLQQAALANPPIASGQVKPVASGAPYITAGAAVLIDAKTGDVLWGKNDNEKRPMASTTKIMTAVLAIEHGNLEDTVTVNRSVLGPGRRGGIGLVEGERLKLRDLLYASMLPSANDAATAIADHIGGSVDGFAEMMNDKALSIGARDTRYANPHGLDEEMHYSTASDLAIIARYALQDKTFSEVVSTKTWRLNRSYSGRHTNIRSTNRLLSSYPGATGGKTGYTRGAGNCLVSSAKRGDVSLISVVLGVNNRKALFEESASLLDFGFGLYESEQLISKDVTYKTATSKYGQSIDLVAAEDVSAVVRNYLPVSTETQTATDIETPIRKGTVLGKVIAYQDGRAVASSDLMAKEDVDEPTLEQLTDYYWQQLLSKNYLDNEPVYLQLLDPLPYIFD